MTNLTLKRYISKTLKLKDYKKDYRSMFQFPKYLNYALIGLLLSDGTLEKSRTTSNVRLSVVMSMNNCSYILHIYNLFEPYINTDIKFLDVYINNYSKTNKKL